MEKDNKDNKGSRQASGGSSAVKGKTQEITVEEWRDGYFVVQPNMWTGLVSEKLLCAVVVHRDWEVVEPVEAGAETVTVREPSVVAPGYVMERKR